MLRINNLKLVDVNGEYFMTDTFITLLIVGSCVIFLGIRVFRSFQGKGGGCGCVCSGGCAPEQASCDNHIKIQTDIR